MLYLQPTACRMGLSEPTGDPQCHLVIGLKERRSVLIYGFGLFRILDKPARRHHVPTVGWKISDPVSMVRFKPGISLKKFVNT